MNPIPRRAPDLTLTTPDDDTVRLADLFAANETTLLVFLRHLG